MYKLQCLNVSKKFLNNCFMGSMQALADCKTWRSCFDDQLNIAYKDQIYDNVLNDVLKHEMAAEFIENSVTDQFIEICDKKRDIKMYMA